jgi:hypothetical protein
VKTNTG